MKNNKIIKALMILFVQQCTINADVGMMTATVARPARMAAIQARPAAPAPVTQQVASGQAGARPVIKAPQFGVGTNNANTDNLWLGFVIGNKYYEVANNTNSSTPVKGASVKINVPGLKSVLNALPTSAWLQGIYFVPSYSPVTHKLHLVVFNSQRQIIATEFIDYITPQETSMGWWGSYIAGAPIACSLSNVFAAGTNANNMVDTFSSVSR